VIAVFKSLHHSRQRVLAIVDENWLSEKELKRMIEEAERYQQDDQEKLTRFKARNDFETFCRDLKSTLERENQSEKKSLIEKCDELIQWLNDTPLATAEEMLEKGEVIMATIRAMEEEAAAIEAIMEDIGDKPSDELHYHDKAQQTSPSMMKKAISFENLAMKPSQELFSHCRYQQDNPLATGASQEVVLMRPQHYISHGLSQQVSLEPRKMQYGRQDSRSASESAMAANESARRPRGFSHCSSQQPSTSRPLLPHTVYPPPANPSQDTWANKLFPGESQQGKSSSIHSSTNQNTSPGLLKKTFHNEGPTQQGKTSTAHPTAIQNTLQDPSKTGRGVEEGIAKKFLRRIGMHRVNN